MPNCNICNKECKSIIGLSTHIRRSHDYDSELYYNKFICTTNDKCKMCNNLTKFKGLTLGYQTYCSHECRCKDPMVISKFSDARLKGQDTKLKKYGSIGYNNHDKTKSTLLNTYGIENVGQLESTKEKIRKTNLERHGVEWYTNRDKYRDGILSGRIDPMKNHGKIRKLEGFTNNYKSSWEMLFQHLNPDFEYEKIRIQYEDLNGKNRIYITDFVNFKTKEIIEIKPDAMVKFYNYPEKERAAIMWAKENGYTFKHLGTAWFNENKHHIPSLKCIHGDTRNV